MRIRELTAERCPPGTRFRVTKVAASRAEQLGFVNDTATLLGATGTATRLVSAGDGFAQLDAEWDQPAIGLRLAAEDEIEIL